MYRHHAGSNTTILLSLYCLLRGNFSTYYPI
nr:MAG TPA: hypothetical protein [Caudoviricetes sp.]